MVSLRLFFVLLVGVVVIVAMGACSWTADESSIGHVEGNSTFNEILHEPSRTMITWHDLTWYRSDIEGQITLAALTNEANSKALDEAEDLLQAAYDQKEEEIALWQEKYRRENPNWTPPIVDSVLIENATSIWIFREPPTDTPEDPKNPVGTIPQYFQTERLLRCPVTLKSEFIIQFAVATYNSPLYGERDVLLAFEPQADLSEAGVFISPERLLHLRSHIINPSLAVPSQTLCEVDLSVKGNQLQDSITGHAVIGIELPPPENCCLWP